MGMTLQERQQGMLADFNAWHEAAKKRWGCAIVLVAGKVRTVQTENGPRIEIEPAFGVSEIVGWVAPEEPHPPTPSPDPERGRTEAPAEGQG